MQNSMLRSRMTLVYWSQPSSVILCIQNSAFSIRITNLYVSQPPFVPFARKTATLGQELQVSMTRINSLYGSQISPVVLCIQNSVISTRITTLHGSQTSPVVLCMQNNVISIINTSLLVPAFICGFVHSKQRA